MNSRDRHDTPSRRTVAVAASLTFLVVLSLRATVAAEHATGAGQPPASEAASGGLQAATLFPGFEENRGQTDQAVRFVYRGGAMRAYFTPDGVMLELLGGGPPRSPAATRSAAALPPRHALRLRLVGAAPDPRLTGEGIAPGRRSLFLGRDPKLWSPGVATFSRIRYREVYPGVDVVFYVDQGHLEYDVEVAAGADPGRVRVALDGTEGLELAPDGDLIAATPVGRLTMRAPRVVQYDETAEVAVASRYELRDGVASFHLEGRQPALPLRIDPVIAYSTFLGGNRTDEATAVAMDAAGNVVVAGRTYSLDFPLRPGALPAKGNSEAFVAKLNPSGTALVYVAVFGGSGDEEIGDLALGSDGSVYLAGTTQSKDFPTVNGYQGSFRGGYDGFVTKLNPSGTQLVYSTYLGSVNGLEMATGIAVGSDGRAVVVGETNSNLFPVKNALQSGTAGGSDCFVTKLESSGSGLVFSTYLGGSGWDTGARVALDATGSIYVAGTTNSTDFPVAAGMRMSAAGENDSFVVKLQSDGRKMTWGTYLGGSRHDSVADVQVDGSGQVVAGGWTASADFPTANPLMPEIAGFTSGFVTKLAANGKSLVYSTYLGAAVAWDPGSGSNGVVGLALDGAGGAIVTGTTESPSLPVVNHFQCGPASGFAVALASDGSAFQFLSYLPPGAWPLAVAAASDGRTVVAGSTRAPAYLTTPGAFDRNCGSDGLCDSGADDAFVLRIDPGPSVITAIDAQPPIVRFTALEQTATVTVTLDRPPVEDLTLTLWTDAYWMVEFPATLLVPAGTTSASFTVRCRHYGETDLIITLPPSVGGCAASVTISHPSPNNFYFEVRPERILPGETALLRVKRDIALATDSVVTLVSSDPETVPVPASLTIPAGYWEATATVVGARPAGAVLITATAPPNLGFPVQTRTLTVALLPEPSLTVVPAVARTSGIAGTDWHTDIAAVNRFAWPASVSLTLRAGSLTATKSATLPAGAAVDWVDVVDSLFQAPPGANLSGEVELASDLPLLVTARTYNRTSTGGTYGQQLPGLPTANLISPVDGIGYLPMLRKTASFRTNVGFLALGTSDDCTVTLRLRGATGGQLGETLVKPLPAGAWTQITDVFDTLHAGTAETAYATIELPWGSTCKVWSYASVIDNATGDPTTIPVQSWTNALLRVPGVAHNPGQLGTQWRTDLALAAPSPRTANVTARFIPLSGSATGEMERTVTVPSGRAAGWANVLESLFGIAPGADAVGRLELVSDAELLAVARTYNQTPDGTYGQLMPGLGQWDPGIDWGSVGVVPQLRKSSRFRSNLGLVALLGQTSVRISLRGADGSLLGPPREVALEPGEWWQVSDVFAWIGAPAADVAYAEVEPLAVWSRVWAYGSMVDNATGDPTTIPAIPYCTAVGVCR